MFGNKLVVVLIVVCIFCLVILSGNVSWNCKVIIDVLLEFCDDICFRLDICLNWCFSGVVMVEVMIFGLVFG